MRSARRPSVWLGFVLLVVALVVASCGADDSSSVDAQAASQAAGALADPNLSVIVEEVADGFGTLGAAQQQAIEGAAQSSEVCDHIAAPRADPEVSQVEVEIVTVVDGCLIFSYEVANFRSLIEDLEQLREPRGVLAVSPLLLDYHLDQNDQTREPTGLSWPVEAIDARASLRANAPTGAGVVIAIIDSGIDVMVGDLDGVDIVRIPDSGEGDYAPGGHGTVAAQVIATPVGDAPRAIAPSVQLLDVPADLCDQATCGCDPCATSTAAEAIRWSTDNGADIISMSFGFRPAPKPAWWQLLLDAGQLDSATETLEIALAYSDANGVAMTAAAGNCAAGQNPQCETDDQFEIPAGHPSVIAVAGLNQQDTGSTNAAWYSTRQEYVELAAPGRVIINGQDGKPVEKVGTSFATPFVAAALAVLVGDDGPLVDQSQSLTQARQILAETAIDLAPTGRDPASGHGQIQLDAAMQQAALGPTN